MNKPMYPQGSPKEVVVISIIAIIVVVFLCLLIGGCAYYRHAWTPDDLREGDVSVIEYGQGQMTVTEGYVCLLYRSYCITDGRRAATARLMSQLVRENEDGTWVIRRDK